MIRVLLLGAALVAVSYAQGDRLTPDQVRFAQDPVVKEMVGQVGNDPRQTIGFLEYLSKTRQGRYVFGASGRFVSGKDGAYDIHVERIVLAWYDAEGHLTQVRLKTRSKRLCFEADEKNESALKDRAISLAHRLLLARATTRQGDLPEGLSEAIGELFDEVWPDTVKKTDIIKK